jgi:hypothetical protein
MNPRTAARLGWSLFGLSVLLLAVAFVLNLRRPQYPDVGATTGELLLGLVLLLFGWFGALIVSRLPGNPIGWILCAFGIVSGLLGFASEYAVYGLITRPGVAPGAAALAWFASWMVAVLLGLLAALLLLFPTGRPPSPGWRWWLWVAVIGNLLYVLSALWAWPQRGADLLRLDAIPEPVGLPGVLYAVGANAGLVAVLAAGVSVLVRFRRARGAERQQVKWLLFAVVTVIVGYPFLGLALNALGRTSEAAADASISVLLSCVPLAVGLAILRYRLYEIDRLINRTLVYGLLTAVLGLGYVAGSLLFVLVAGAGSDPPSWLVAGGTLTAAAAFRPARRRIQAAVDRRFNRRRYHAAKTIEAFSARLRDEVDLDMLSAELVAMVDQTIEPTRVSLWLRPTPPGSWGTARSEARPTSWVY